jgi:hypothetical protein
MHLYSAPTTPPSRSSEIWWSGRWDRQHDGVVSMVESMRRQSFACLRGGRRTEKGGSRNRAMAPPRFSLPSRRPNGSFYSRRDLHNQLGHAISYDRIVDHRPRSATAICDRHPYAVGPKAKRPMHVSVPGIALATSIKSIEPCMPWQRALFFSFSFHLFLLNK